MSRKRRKIKKHYTISVTSDYAPDSTKYYRSRFNLFNVMYRTMFLVVLLGVALTAFEFYELNVMGDKLSSFKSIIYEQEQMIKALGDEKAELASQNQVLNNTVAMNLEKEAEEQAVDAEKHLPTSFPLTGSATIADPDVFFAEEMDATTAYFEAILAQKEKENAEETQTDPLTLFVMSEVSDVVAAADGKVMAIVEDPVYKNSVMIDHGNGYITIYKNIADPKVFVGDEVVRGAIIYVGGEDNNYLGYQITYEGQYVDPMHIIAING